VRYCVSAAMAWRLSHASKADGSRLKSREYAVDRTGGLCSLARWIRLVGGRQ
jgi:hypothetical protein